MPKETNPFVYATQTVAGLDFSLRCPSICIIEPCTDNQVILPFDKCHFYYMTNVKSHIVNENNIHGELISGWTNEQDRYSCLADWVMKVLEKHSCVSLGIEDYAFSKISSSLTKLAESCGLIKWFAHSRGIDINRFSPTSIKKFATSKGNADKNLMYQAFLDDTNVELNSIFGRTADANIKSPVHDIVDSFYIAMSQRVDSTATHQTYESNSKKGKE